MFGVQLGEIAPGGTGSGLYGMLIMAVVPVFIAGLMVGRTPEHLGKKIGTRESKLAACCILITPALVLPTPPHPMTNTGAHGFSEILHAYTSGANNGSASAGLNADTQWFNTTTGLAMPLGRLLPMVSVLALAGSLAGQRPVPATAFTTVLGALGRPLSPSQVPADAVTPPVPASAPTSPRPMPGSRSTVSPYATTSPPRRSPGSSAGEPASTSRGSISPCDSW